MIAVTLMVLLMGAATTPAQAQDTDAFERQRAEMLDRQRRLILNNDGGDAVMAAREATPEGMLKPRTLGLEDTHVDTIFYCTNRGTFSRHTHRSEVSEVFTGTEGRYQHNITAALIEQGTDSLQVMIDWCHDNDVEVFWTERMNDRHDSALKEAVSEWKRQHPECLMSTIDKPTPHGAWSQVDYSHEAVRDQMLAIIEEVCTNYDVDGIEMDYFRHPCYFRTVAWGGHATDDEIETMTGFVRRVRAMTERVGRERGRPILIALRVVDSVPLARAMGLDIEAWMSEDLVDLVTGSGYFRMNPWGYLVELGREHNVKIYAGLSDSRVKADTSRFNRRSRESYRARASRAWQAGVDGIYLFNMFNPGMGMLHDIGDPETLARQDKTYFATVRGSQVRSYGNPDYWVADGSQWRNVPVLTPEDAITVLPGTHHSIRLYIGDGLAGEVACHVAATGGDRLVVQLNGQALVRESIDDQWLRFPLPEGLLQPGENVFELSALAVDETNDDPVEVEWTADALPKMPWGHDTFRSKRTFAELQEDALLLFDRGTEPGDYLYFRYPWGAQADSPAQVEVEAKIISGWNNITVSNGVGTERVMLYPDYIGTYYGHLRYDMDTTDEFHTYRVVVEGEDIRVYVDGELRLDGAGMFTREARGRNDLAFGASNSPSVGEALWRSVRLRTPGTAHPQVYDLAVTVRFPGDE